MRITATLKPNSELENYIVDQMDKTGFSAAQSLVSLAIQGLEYKQALSTMSSFAKALEQQNELSKK